MLLKGATLVGLDPPHVEPADLRIEGERIAERGRDLRGGEEAVDLSGCLVLPGLVNAHTHLYSALARGMPWPRPAPRNFIEILEKVWWRLDRALDEDAVYHSAMVGADGGGAVRHHAAHRPPLVAVVHRGIAGHDPARGGGGGAALGAVLRGHGPQRDGRAATPAWPRTGASVRAAPSPLTRGMVGAHASFTLSDDSLAKLADAGGGDGLEPARARGGGSRRRRGLRARATASSLVERFDRHRLLISRTLFAHCVHLTPDEVQVAHTKGAWIAHNPRSNMNNAVGYAPTAALRRAALGTDGIDGDMLAEARAAYLKMREAGRADAMDATLELVAGGHRLGAALFGLPFGKLDAGAPADLVVLDYRPPDPPHHRRTWAATCCSGSTAATCDRCMVAGRWVVRDRALVQVDGRAVAAQARTAAAASVGADGEALGLQLVLGRVGPPG